MSYSLEDERLISETANVEYRVGALFQIFLKTVPDTGIPRSIIMLGVLTEELEPVGIGTDQHIRLVSQKVENAPTVSISEEAVKRVMWLLSSKKETLDKDRKMTIGRLVTVANLNSPAEAETSAASTESREENQRDDNVGESKPPANGEKEKAQDEHKCEYCDRAFQDQTKLDSHVPTCPADDAEYECDDCGKEYKNKRQYEHHIDNCDGDRDSQTEAGDNSSGIPASVGKEIKKDGRGERKTGRNPFANPDRLKDAGLHEGGN